MSEKNTSRDLVDYGADDPADHEIDAALHMLGRIDPPTGQVERIRMRLHGAAETGKKRWAARLWLPVGCAALAAIVLAALLLPSFKRNTPLPTNTVASASAPLATTKASAGVAEEFAPSVVETATGNVRRTVRRAHRRRVVKNPLDYPLTRQERLLILFVQNAKPADLQILNPAYQAKLEAKQDAEFAAYVEAGDSSSRSGSGQATTEE